MQEFRSYRMERWIAVRFHLEKTSTEYAVVGIQYLAILFPIL